MSEKKLKIIGPYTPEHPGPFCTRDGRCVRVLCRDGARNKPIIGLVCSDGYDDFIVELTGTGRYRDKDLDYSRYDLMNAEEVPVAREFWVNEYEDGMRFGNLQTSLERAAMNQRGNGYIRTIHVREVLPGDGE